MDISKFFLVAILLSIAANTSADSITLVNGDVLQGTISSQSDAEVVLQHEILGNLSIPRAQIEKLQSDQPQQAESQIKPLKTEDRGLLNSGFFTDWNRSLNVALNGSEGVNNDAKLRVGFDMDYKDEVNRWIFATVYNVKSDSNDITENNFYATLDRDWLLPESPWFWFARSRYDWDDFKDWDHRVSFYIGPGYQFIENETWNIRGRSGLGGKYTWNGANDGFEPEAMLGMDLEWSIAENQSLKASSTYYPSLETWGEYRNISSLDWKIDISEFYRGVALNSGFTNEYDSQGLSKDSNYDLKYYFGLKLGL